VTNQRYQPYRSLLLSREEVMELSKLSPARAFRDLIWLWIQIVTAWAVAGWLHSWWACALAAAFVGNRYYSLYIIGHDGLHRRLHDRRVVNDLVNDLLVMGPIGAITRLNRHNHMTHHITLHCHNDPDAYKYRSRQHMTLLGYFWSLTAVPFVLRAVGNVLRSPANDRSNAERRTARDVVIILGWQILLVSSLSMVFGWWGYFAMWWIPVYAFTFATDLTRVFCEHSVPDTDDIALCDRLNTFDANWLELTLFAPMNMNHHAAHHLWPSIPYYNLPRATAQMRLRFERLPKDAEPSASRRSYIEWLLWRLRPMGRETA